MSFNDGESTAQVTIIALIPAFNEARNIERIVKEAQKYVSFVIVIDDGSVDNTSAIASSAGAKVLRNRRNMGKGVALKKGFRECLRYHPDIVVTLDADGQHDPADIPRLIEPITKRQSDIVIGSRFIREESKKEIPTYRKIGLSIVDFLDKRLIKTPVKDTQSGFRAYSSRVLDVVSNFEATGYGVESEQLALADLHSLSITEIPITIKYKGLDNTSKKNSFFHATEIVSSILRLAVERRPLLFFGLPGFILIMISFGTALNLLFIFNETRYFSIPLAIVSIGLVFVGSLLILASLVLYAITRIQRKLVPASD